MKLTEIKYTKRFNLGNYEHEEISIAVAPEEGDTYESVLNILKNKVDGMPREVTQTQPTASVSAPPKPQSSDLGSYIIPIGHKEQKGFRLDAVDIFDLDKSVKWWIAKSREDGKPLSGKAKEFVEKAEAFLNSRQKQR